MVKQKFVDGLATLAALVIILGVSSAARSAFASELDTNLNSAIETPQNR